MLYNQNKKNSNAVSRLPIPVSKKTTPPSEQKKKKRTSTLFAPTCSRMAREADNFNDRAKRAITKKQTPPIITTGLPKKDPMNIFKNNKQNKLLADRPKNDYLQLKKKIHQDEKLIMKQAEEIARLKKWITNTLHRIELAEKETHLETRKRELELQLEKIQLDKKLKTVAVQTESCHAYILLTSAEDDELNKLKKQLETQERKHNLKLAEYNKLLCTKDNQIQQQQTKYEQIKKDHANTIQQLNTLHCQNMRRIESQTDSSNNKKTTIDKTLESELERILIEFEQEQHNHPAVIPPKKSDCIIISKHRSVHHGNINQQWWSKRFIPTDAASWPSPQPLSNLRKPLIDKTRYCI